jgi:hypothetical protein
MANQCGERIKMIPPWIEELVGFLEGAAIKRSLDLQNGDNDTFRDEAIQFITNAVTNAVAEACTPDLGPVCTCFQCLGKGWYSMANRNTGDEEQEQCEMCCGSGKIHIVPYKQTHAQ